MPMTQEAVPRTAPPGFREAADHARLREALTEAGFTVGAVCERLAIPALRVPDRTEIPMFLDRTSTGRPLDTFIRLFVVGVRVAEDDLARAAGALSPERLLEARVVVHGDGGLVAPLRLLPVPRDFHLWVASDRPEHRTLPDFVMGLAPATLTLANVTVRRPTRSMLDLCSGCGVHGLLAAQHCEHVLATDLNDRAVEFARFNARLNGITGFEAVTGDMLEPVAGRRFDLIVANPPFVISPDSRLLFRDGRGEEDDVCRRLVQSIPAHLEEGGFCQILGNWVVHEGEVWKERLADWFEGTGCDAWIVRAKTEAYREYARTWIGDTEDLGGAELRETYDRWIRYYRDRGIANLSQGLITMRRTSAPLPHFRAEDAPRLFPPAGDDIELGFELLDFLREVDDGAMLGTSFRIDPEVRLEQRLSPGPDGWSLEKMSLHRTKGLAREAQLDPYAAELLVRCTGDRSLGQILREMAAQIGREPSEVEHAGLDVARRYVELGYLLPPELAQAVPELRRT